MNDEEYLRKLKIIASDDSLYTLIKLPPGPIDIGKPIFDADGYAIYMKGDLIPLWVNSKCDHCDDKGCHHIWDHKRQKWRMACVSHFDQFMTKKRQDIE